MADPPGAGAGRHRLAPPVSHSPVQRRNVEVEPRREAEGGSGLPLTDPVPLRRSVSRSRHLERRTPSGEEGGGRVHLDYVLGLVGGEDARRPGILVHAWLETLEWV